MVIDVGYCSKVFRKIIYLLITLVAIYLCFKLAIFYIPFLIGFIISVMIEPIIKALVNKTKFTRKPVAIIVMLVIFIILIGLIIWGIISVITESSDLLQSLNIYIENLYTKIQYYISNINFDRLEIPSQVITLVQNSTENFIKVVTNWVSNFLTSIIQGITSLPIFGIYVVITLLSTYFICADRMYILDQLEHHFPRLWIKKLGMHIRKIISSLGNYLKAEATLILISFILVLVGLYVLKFIGLNIPYPLLIALGIGFVDALPILGSGTVMLPWAIVSGINGDIKLAIGLLILYALILIARQFIEPKLVSSKIGIHPIFTLIAMYTGFKITGIIGLFIGPIILIILKNIFETAIEDGFFKTLFLRN